ncbi:hypothetical protein ES703_15003 [subsurface metagenome]
MSSLGAFFLTAFLDDLVGDFRCGFEGLSAVDQFVDYGMPGELDGGLTLIVANRRWEAPATLGAVLVFAEIVVERESADQLDIMLRAGDKPGVDHSLRTVGLLNPDELVLPECPEPSANGAFGDVESLGESPVPEPARVGAKAVEISEKVFL